MKIAKVTAVIAASLLIGAASVLAQDTSSQQSGASQQTDQSGISQQSGSSSQAGGLGEQMQEAAGAAITQIAQDPQSFIKEAYQANQAEIQLGKLAQQKGQSTQVKDFGQQLAQAHQGVSDKLQQLAQQKNIQLSQDLSPRYQMRIDQLSALSGQDFDKQFLSQQVRMHKKDVALYEKAAQSNTDQDVKSFAQSTVPSLRQHLQMAQQQSTSINEAAGAGQQGQQDQMQQDQSQQSPDQSQSQSPDQSQQPQSQQSPQ